MIGGKWGAHLNSWFAQGERLATVVIAFIRRHWQGALEVREKLRVTEETFHLIMAGVVGVLGALINVLFQTSFNLVKTVVFHNTDDLVAAAESLDWWHRLLIPTLGSLAAGLVLHWGLRLVGPQGSSHLLEVVVVGDGRLPFRTAVIKGLSSVLSISTGASIGREGAITQLTATLGSKFGQLARWQPYRLRLLVACGAASGIAAAYNAPIAGAVFAAQIVLGNFSMTSFAPLVFASVIAAITSRSFFGIQPWYEVPTINFTRITELPSFVLLGVIAGLLGALFLKMLRTTETLFLKIPQPIYVRLAIGGAIVGLIAISFPEVWGNGYSVTNRILHADFPLGILAGLFLAKLLATLATVGSGAVGGVLTPTLFLGAGLGSAFGITLHWANSAESLPASVFALVGMGGVLSATTHSPLLAMILVFEISLNYSLMPPLMLGCVIATLVSRAFNRESVYTEPLRLESLSALRESSQIGIATQKTVGDLMRAPVPPIRETTTFRQIADRFLTSSNNFLPVVDEGERLIGLVALQDLKEYLKAENELSSVIAYDVMRPAPVFLTPNQRLLDTLPILLASEQRNVPVVTSEKQPRLVGALARAEVLALFSEALAAGAPAKAERRAETT
jgi:CIC family chloride channel protein